MLDGTPTGRSSAVDTSTQPKTIGHRSVHPRSAASSRTRPRRSTATTASAESRSSSPAKQHEIE